MRTRSLIRRVVRALAFAAAAAAVLAWRSGAAVAQSPPVCGTDLRLLVVSADGGERDLPAIRSALDYLGAPYDLYIATQHPSGLTPDRLATGCHANYQGIILTTETLTYAGAGGLPVSALTSGEFQALSDYEAAFNVRQVTWFTVPTVANGFNDQTNPTSAPITVDATGPGAQLFTYLNTTPSAASIPINGVSAYLTTPFDASTVPLLVDAQGHSLAGVHTYPNGRQNLAMLFDSDASSLHAALLSYGVINWVTNGLFIG